MHLYGYINLIESALGLIFSLTILSWSRLIGIEMQFLKKILFGFL